MNKYLISSLFVSCLFIFDLSSKRIARIQDSGVETISAQDLKKEMETSKDLYVYNVLDYPTYSDCHIKGSKNAPLANLASISGKWSKDRNMVVYCALKECDASLKAYRLLKSLGFRNVRAYEGGIKEWFQLGYPSVGPCSMSYLHQR